MLRDCDAVTRPYTLDGNVHVWHLYVVCVPNRDAVLKELHAAGVGAGIHYPVPVHLTEAFAWLGYAKGAFPVAEKSAAEIISLPLFPRDHSRPAGVRGGRVADCTGSVTAQ